MSSEGGKEITVELIESLNFSNQLTKTFSLNQIVKLLQDSYEILKIEPVGSPEHSISLAALDALKKMGNIA